MSDGISTPLIPIILFSTALFALIFTSILIRKARSSRRRDSPTTAAANVLPANRGAHPTAPLGMRVQDPLGPAVDVGRLPKYEVVQRERPPPGYDAVPWTADDVGRGMEVDRGAEMHELAEEGDLGDWRGGDEENLIRR